jgi:cytochrome P450
MDFPLSLKLTRLEWQRSLLFNDIIHLIAHGTPKAFLGDGFHEKERWSNLSESYVKDFVISVPLLWAWPKILRPVVHWILPHTSRLREEEREACRIMNSFLEKRRLEGPKDGSSPRFLNFMEQVALEKGRPSFNLAHGQLGIGLGLVIPVAAMLTNILFDLTANPESIPALREEIKSALEAGGWKKTTLSRMRLLDSVMKETFRLRPFLLSKLNFSKLSQPIKGSFCDHV